MQSVYSNKNENNRPRMKTCTKLRAKYFLSVAQIPLFTFYKQGNRSLSRTKPHKSGEGRRFLPCVPGPRACGQLPAVLTASFPIPDAECAQLFQYRGEGHFLFEIQLSCNIPRFQTSCIAKVLSEYLPAFCFSCPWACLCHTHE